jgi:hypothetical protein
MTALEVVWPRHKWDYLTVLDPDIPPDPPLLPSTWAHAERSDAASFDVTESNGARTVRQKRSTAPILDTRPRGRVARSPCRRSSSARRVLSGE